MNNSNHPKSLCVCCVWLCRTTSFGRWDVYRLPFTIGVKCLYVVQSDSSLLFHIILFYLFFLHFIFKTNWLLLFGVYQFSFYLFLAYIPLQTIFFLTFFICSVGYFFVYFSVAYVDCRDALIIILNVCFSLCLFFCCGLARRCSIFLNMGNKHWTTEKIPIRLWQQASPYLAGMPQLSSPYSHYVSASPMLQVVSPAEAAVNSQLGVVAAAQAGGAGVGGYGAPANKLQRSDRIEVSFTFRFFSAILFFSLSLLVLCTKWRVWYYRTKTKKFHCQLVE